jgi:hypothetical protein
MDFNNIAIVFAPTLLLEDTSKYTAMSSMINSTKSRNFVVNLLENFSQVFSRSDL